MFLKYLEPIFRPFREAKAKALQAKQMPDRLKGDLSRAKAQAGAVKGQVAKGQAQVAGAAKDAKAMGAQAQQAGTAAQGAAAGAAAKPGVKKVGLFGKKRVCAKCG